MTKMPPEFTFKPRSKTTRVIIHESHTPASVTNAVGLLRAQGRANGLLEIGYHYVIERDGRFTETRLPSRIGSHAPGCNHDSIGICLAADKDWVMTEHAEQMNTLARIYGTLVESYGHLKVFGHDEVVRRRDRTHKCPSFDMYQVKGWLFPT